MRPAVPISPSARRQLVAENHTDRDAKQRVEQADRHEPDVQPSPVLPRPTVTRHRRKAESAPPLCDRSERQRRLKGTSIKDISASVISIRLCDSARAAEHLARTASTWQASPRTPRSRAPVRSRRASASARPPHGRRTTALHDADPARRSPRATWRSRPRVAAHRRVGRVASTIAAC